MATKTKSSSKKEIPFTATVEEQAAKMVKKAKPAVKKVAGKKAVVKNAKRKKE